MDYSFFDSLIDAVFVVNSDRGIIYCNESAAKLCESSVRRLAKGKPIHDVIEFTDDKLFVMPNGTMGFEEPAPYSEIQYKLKTGKEGKVQIAIQPFSEPTGDKRAVVIVRDVTIEEVLHAKHHKQLQELEAYSKNLEKMVEERTQEVKRANVMLSAIMNSLGQGFFVFDKQGQCLPFYTKACEDILETSPSGKHVQSVLKVQDKDLSTFKMWTEAIFAEQLPFDTMKELGPTHFHHSQERHVKLDYFPLRDESEKIESVVVVATDQTSEYLANKALEKEKKFARMVIKLITNKKPFEQFLKSIPHIIQEVSLTIKNHEVQPHVDEIFRALHTMEGEAGTYSVSDIWESSRKAQEVIEPLRKGQPFDPQTIKQELLTKLKDLHHVYSEFMSSNSELFTMIGLGKPETLELSRDIALDVIQFLVKKGVGQEVCDYVADQLLREPIVTLVNQYKDLVLTVAEKLGKQVEPLAIQDNGVRVYSENYQELFASLVHAFRNSIDHGIEPAEEREMSGKPAKGKITMDVSTFIKNKSNWLRLVITDDGKGVDTDRLRAKLAAKYSPDDLKAKSDFEIAQHIFDAGLSTRESVGEYSGRGIGMSAVKVEAQRLGGDAIAKSEVGKGCQIIIEIPDLPRVDHLKATA